ncbi:ribosylnicotinamide kinase [Savitreella phatthalungensis]
MSRCIVVGVSGASGTGKTTVCRALHSILQSSVPARCKVRLLHQDDFYKPEALLPRRFSPTAGQDLVDWDCPGALDLPAMRDAIADYKASATGSFSPHTERDLQQRSKEDQNAVSTSSTVSPAARDAALRALQEVAWGSTGGMLLVDGFMLHHRRMGDAGEIELLDVLDVSVHLRDDPAELKRRREQRSYATLEGTWTDPPGYWDDIIWPGYVEWHSWLYEDSDVRGSPRPQNQTGVVTQRNTRGSLDESFILTVEAITAFMKDRP